MTWEDFWNYAEDAGNFGRRDNSRKEAKQIGFQDYLKERYTLSELNEIFQPAVAFLLRRRCIFPDAAIMPIGCFMNFMMHICQNFWRTRKNAFRDFPWRCVWTEIRFQMQTERE